LPKAIIIINNDVAKIAIFLEKWDKRDENFT
jgi:hypothetical protein